MILDLGHLAPETLALLQHATGLIMRLNDHRLTPTAREELRWLHAVLEYEQSRPPEPEPEETPEKVAGADCAGSGF